MITELFYLRHILHMKRGSPFLDTDELKMVLQARKVTCTFEKRVPGPWVTLFSTLLHFFSRFRCSSKTDSIMPNLVNMLQAFENMRGPTNLPRFTNVCQGVPHFNKPPTDCFEKFVYLLNSAY